MFGATTKINVINDPKAEKNEKSAEFLIEYLNPDKILRSMKTLMSLLWWNTIPIYLSSKPKTLLTTEEPLKQRALTQISSVTKKLKTLPGIILDQSPPRKEPRNGGREAYGYGHSHGK